MKIIKYQANHTKNLLLVLLGIQKIRYSSHFATGPLCAESLSLGEKQAVDRAISNHLKRQDAVEIAV